MGGEAKRCKSLRGCSSLCYRCDQDGSNPLTKEEISLFKECIQNPILNRDKDFWDSVYEKRKTEISDKMNKKAMELKKKTLK